MLGGKTTRFCETKHEDDFHDGGSRSNLICRGFFHRNPGKGGKGGTDRTFGALLPVIRSRKRLQLFKPRAMRGNGFGHRRQLHNASR